MSTDAEPITVTLSPEQQDLLAKLFEQLEVAMGSAGCNDFDVPNTKTLRDFIADAQDDSDLAATIRKPRDGEEFCTYDWAVLNAFQKLLTPHAARD